MSVPVLYEANATDFFNKGLGTLPDALTAVVTEERNGELIFEMTYPVNGARADLLENNRIIKVDAGHVLTDQRFVIKKVTPQMSDDGKTYIDVYAEHISYVTNDLALKPSVAVNGSADNAIKEWQRSIVDGNSIVADSDITTNGQTTWTIDKVQNARQALGGVDGSILDVWGGEYLFDNLHISLKKQRGSVSNSLLAYGRNITSFQQEENIQNTYTSIYPYATLSSASDDTSQLYTLNGYFVDSQYVNNYPNRKILPVDFSSNFEDVKVGAKPADASTDDKTTYLSVSDVQAQLKSFAQKYITDNAVGIPTVSITVSFVDLSKTSNYADVAPLEQLDLCDTVPVRFSKLGINTTAKVTHVEWNVLTDSYNAIELGSITPTLGQTLSTLTTVAQAAKQAAQDAQNNAITAWKSADGKTTTFDGSSSQGFPIAQHIGDLYFRENGDNTELYIWSGAEWKFIVSNKTGQNISDAVDQAMSDADVAKQNANNAVETGNQVLAKAQTGIDTANAAADKASNASVDASKAINDSASAITQAQSAASAASDASVDASKAINDSASAIAQAQRAANDASTAIDQAQQIANGLTTLQNTVSDNNSAISKAQKDINTAQNNITAAQADLATAKNNIATNADAIKDANGNIGLLQTSASKFQNSITDVQGDISILQQDSTSFKSEIGSLQADNGTNKQNISTLQNTVNGFNSTVAQVQQQVNDSAIGANLLTGTSSIFQTNSTWIHTDILKLSDIGLSAGDTVTLSAFLDLTNINSDGCVSIIAQDSSSTSIGNDFNGNIIDSGTADRSIISYVIPVGAIYLKCNVYAATGFKHKEEKLEAGLHATPWCLAPSEQATVTQISTLSNTLDGLSSAVSKKANQSDLNSASTQISNLSNTISGLSSTVASKANNSDLQSTNTKVSNLSNTVDGLNVTVSSVQSTANQTRTDVTTLKQQATGFQTSISSLQQTKADQSWTTNQITATSNSLKITIADIQGQVNDSAVGANLLTGTSSDTRTKGATGWADYSDSTNGVSFSTISGQTYTYSVYLINPSSNTSYVQCYFREYTDGDGSHIDHFGTAIGPGKSGYSTVTFTPSHNAGRAYTLRFVDYVSSNTYSLQFNKEKLEAGSHATPWCLAPSEVATATSVTSLSATVDGLSATVSKKVDNNTFTSYQNQTATAIADKVSSNTFNSYKTQTDSAIQSKVSSADYNTKVTQLSNQISSKVSSDTFNSQIQQLSDNINLRVQKNDVINQINVSSESILIAGNKVHITGSTTIDNAVIKSAMIDSLSANKITTGTLNAANVNIINMNADNISTGTLTADRISGGTLTGVSFHKSSSGHDTWIDQNGIHDYDNTNDSFWVKQGTVTITGGNGNKILMGNTFANMALASEDGHALVFDLTTGGFGYYSSYDPTYFYGNGRAISSLTLSNDVTKMPAQLSSANGIQIDDLTNNNSIHLSSSGIAIASDSNSTNFSGSGANFYEDVWIASNFSVTGSKNAIVETSAGWTRINAYETAEYYFGDMAKVNTGSGSKVKIMMDSLFLETVNTNIDYHVFVSSYSAGYAWVSEQTSTYFVIESNVPNLEVSYEIKAKRKGYENVRLEIDKDFRKEAA